MPPKAPDTVRILSFDMDRCLFHPGYHQERKKHDYRFADSTVVSANIVFLDKLKKENKAFTDVACYLGSARQDSYCDWFNAKQNGTESGFIALLAISRYLKTRYFPTCLAQAYTYKRENMFDRAIDLAKAGQYIKKNRWIYDSGKFSILYYQMHQAALEHPGKNIQFDFYDDRADILNGLYRFFQLNPYLIPKNVTLYLHRYTGNKTIPHTPPLKGLGEIDENYSNHIQYIGNQIRDNGRKDKDDFISYLSDPSLMEVIYKPQIAHFQSTPTSDSLTRLAKLRSIVDDLNDIANTLQKKYSPIIDNIQDIVAFLQSGAELIMADPKYILKPTPELMRAFERLQQFLGEKLSGTFKCISIFHKSKTTSALTKLDEIVEGLARRFQAPQLRIEQPS